MSGGRQKTKIIATLGDPPASYPGGVYDEERRKYKKPTLDQVLDIFFRSGVDVIRLNLAHIPPDELGSRFRSVKKAIIRAEGKHKRKVGVMVDLPGPKIRFGDHPWRLPTETLNIAFDDCDEDLHYVKGAGTRRRAPRSSTACVRLDHEPFDQAAPHATKAIFQGVRDRLKSGPRPILAFIGDNDATLEVVDTTEHLIVCRVIAARAKNQIVLENKGFTIRGVSKPVSAFTERDKKRLTRLLRMDHADAPRIVSHIGISFCQTREDVGQVLYHVTQEIQKLGHVNDLSDGLVEAPLLIAKIETTDGVKNIAEILDFADGAMIARGDLALAVEAADLPEISKEIIDHCNLRGKVVIMATQMLESMETNIECNRPEATDVFNAVVDGADALMLSGETSRGMYPAHAIEKMRDLAWRAEKFVSRMPMEEDVPTANHAEPKGNAPLKEDAQIHEYFKKLMKITRRVGEWQGRWRDITIHYEDLFAYGAISLPFMTFISELAGIKRRRLRKQNSTDRISHAACSMAGDPAVGGIVAPTRSGRTARMLARFRPRVWIWAQPHTDFVGRKLTIDWGVRLGEVIEIQPRWRDAGALIHASRKAIRNDEWLADATVIFTCGTPLGQVGTTNLIQRWDPPH